MNHEVQNELEDLRAVVKDLRAIIAELVDNRSEGYLHDDDVIMLRDILEKTACK